MPGSNKEPPLILVVDDDDCIRALLAATLTHEGYTVALAEDATQALTMLSAVRFPLVISDHAMPGKTGGCLIQEIRRRYPDTRTLLMSAGVHLPHLAHLAGADRYFRKCSPLAELVACVRELLGARDPADVR